MNFGRPLVLAVALLMSLAGGVCPSVAQTAQVIDHVDYLGKAGDFQGTLYLPNVSGTPVPAIVILHGGGWHSGSRDNVQVRNTASFLQAHGYAVLAINYPLGTPAQPVVWPENLMDSKIAVQWLRVNAGKFNIDPKHIGIVGFSAGAHLAMLVAFTASDPELKPAQPYPEVSTAVQAVVNFYGPAVLPPPAERWFGPLPLPPSIVSQATPIDYVKPGLPPILISYGSHDQFYRFFKFPRFIAALAASGVPHQVYVVDGAQHGFDPTEPTTDVSGEMLSFLNAYLVPHAG